MLVTYTVGVGTCYISSTCCHCSHSPSVRPSTPVSVCRAGDVTRVPNMRRAQRKRPSLHCNSSLPPKSLASRPDANAMRHGLGIKGGEGEKKEGRKEGRKEGSMRRYETRRGREGGKGNDRTNERGEKGMLTRRSPPSSIKQQRG